MSDTAVSTTALIPGTAGDDILAAGTAISTGNTAVITVGNDGGEASLLLVIQETASSTATLSVEAGDYPPAATSAKGADSVSMAADDVIPYIVEAGRHLQNNGTIRILVTGAVRIFAYRLPRGYG